MPVSRIPQAAKRRLLLLIAAGGGIGALAAAAPSRAWQLTLVGLAACLGIYAGLTLRRTLHPPEST